MKRRLVFGGLLASVLLHAALLDYWRGQAPDTTRQSSTQFEARLRPQPSPPLSGQPPAARMPTADIASEGAPSPLPTAGAPRAPETVAAPVSVEPPAASEGFTSNQDVPGFRAMNREEAMVALRIAALRALAGQAGLREWMGEQSRRDLRLQLSVDGHLSGADMPPSLAQALHAVEVPVTLRGMPAEVVLSFER